jgi:hypothetical protein|tara:strand:+ start:232 stop:486 length:255 start_codon:yes stop_codon:yes gene_type:complete
MIAEGKKWHSCVFILDRILRYNGTRCIKDTKTIKITGKLVEELFLDEKELEEGEKARKIIFKSKTTALIWKNNSKIGTLYEIRT